MHPYVIYGIYVYAGQSALEDIYRVYKLIDRKLDERKAKKELANTPKLPGIEPGAAATA